MPSTSDRADERDAPADQPPAAATPGAGHNPDFEAGGGPGSDPDTADLFVRNYDVDRTYRVRLRATTPDGTTREKRYRLLPGQVVAEFGVLPAGDCRIEVSLPGTVGRGDRCSLDRDDDGTVAVEVGNGVVAVGERDY